MSQPIDPAKTHVMPMLLVDSIEKALEYYNGVLGFETTTTMLGPDNATLVHAELKHGPTTLMFGRRDRATGFDAEHAKDPLGRGVYFYAYVPHIDEFHRRISAKGARIIEEPKDQYWGDRTLTLADPQGYVWTFAQAVSAFDPNKLPWRQQEVAAATA